MEAILSDDIFKFIFSDENIISNQISLKFVHTSPNDN